MLTYEEVKETVKRIVLERPEFVYTASEDCPTCDEHRIWEEGGWTQFGKDEPPLCHAHKQESCLYFYANDLGQPIPSRPACIVGHWFHAEGLQPEDFGVRRWDEIEGRGVNAVLPGLMQEIEPEAVDFLWNMQSLQDTGSTWLNSYVTATARVEGRTNV